MANRNVTIDIRTAAQTAAIGTLIEQVSKLKVALSELTRGGEGSFSFSEEVKSIESLAQAMEEMAKVTKEANQQAATAQSESLAERLAEYRLFTEESMAVARNASNEQIALIREVGDEAVALVQAQSNERVNIARNESNERIAVIREQGDAEIALINTASREKIAAQQIASTETINLLRLEEVQRHNLITESLAADRVTQTAADRELNNAHAEALRINQDIDKAAAAAKKAAIEAVNTAEREAYAEEAAVEKANQQMIAQDYQNYVNQRKAADAEYVAQRRRAEAEVTAMAREADQLQAQAYADAAQAAQVAADRTAAAVRMVDEAFTTAREVVTSFGTALSEAIGTGAEVASGAMRTFEETSISGLSTLRESILETGSVFRMFGTDVAEGMGRAESATRSFYAAGWSLVMIGQQISMVGKQILSGATTDLDKYLAFEKNITQASIASTDPNNVDATGAIINNSQVLKDTVFEMQKTGVLIGDKVLPVWTQSADQLAKGIYILASATGTYITSAKDAEVTAQRVVPMLQAAAITQTDPETAIKGFLAAANEFGINTQDSTASRAQQDQTTQMLDKTVAAMVDVVQKTPLEMTDLAQSMKMVGPLAHYYSDQTSSKDIADILALIGSLSDVGLRGGRVGSGIGMLIQSEASPTVKMQNAFANAFGAGPDQVLFDATGHFKDGLFGMIEPMQKLFDITKDSTKTTEEQADAQQKLNQIVQAFPQNAQRDVVGLLESIHLSGGLATVQGLSSELQGSDPLRVLSENILQQHDTIFGNIDNLRNAWFAMQAEIITAIQGPLKSAIKSVADVVWEVEQRITENPWIGKLLAGVVVFSGALLAVLGTLLTFGGGLILVAGAFSKMGGAMEGITGMMELLPAMFGSMVPVFLILSVAGIAAFAAWRADLGGIQEQVANFGNTLRNVLLPALVEVANFMLHTALAFDEFISSILLGVGSTQDLQAWLVQVFGMDKASAIFSYLTQFASWMDNLRMSVEAFFGTLPGRAASAVSAIEDFGKRAVAVFVGLSVEIANSGFFQSVAANIESVFNNQTIQAMKDFASGFVRGLAEGFAGLILVVAKFVEYLSQLFANMPSYVQSLGNFLEKLTGMDITARGLGEALGIGFGIFLGGELLAALGPVADIIDFIITKMALFVISLAEAAISVATFTAEIAINAVANVIQFGIEVATATVELIAFAATGIASAVTGLIALSAETLITFGAFLILLGGVALLIGGLVNVGQIFASVDIFGGIKTGFSDMMTILKSDDAWGNLKTYLVGRMTEAIKAMEAAFFQGISDMFQAYADKFKAGDDKGLTKIINSVLGAPFGGDAAQAAANEFGSGTAGGAFGAAAQARAESQQAGFDVDAQMQLLKLQEENLAVYNEIVKSKGMLQYTDKSQGSILFGDTEGEVNFLNAAIPLWEKYNAAIAGGASTTGPNRVAQLADLKNALEAGNTEAAKAILSGPNSDVLQGYIAKGEPILVQQAKDTAAKVGGSFTDKLKTDILSGDWGGIKDLLQSTLGVNLDDAMSMATDLINHKTSVSDIMSKFTTTLTGIGPDGKPNAAVQNQIDQAMKQWNDIYTKFYAQTGGNQAAAMAASRALWESIHPGEPIPIDPAIKDWAAAQVKQNADAIKAYEDESKKLESELTSVSFPDIMKALVEKSKPGDTSLGVLFASEQSALDSFLSNYHYGSGSGTNTEDLISHALTSFVGRSVSGKNIGDLIKNDPGIQHWAAEAGIAIPDLIAEVIKDNGGSTVIFDPNLMPAATLDLNAWFEKMKVTGHDQVIQDLNDKMDINWDEVMHFAASKGANKWNLGDFFAEQWGMTKAQAEEILRNNGINPDDVSNALFPDVKNQVESNFGQFNVLTKENYDTLAGIESTGADGIIKMSTKTWDGLDASVKLMLTKDGWTVVLDDTKKKHKAIADAAGKAIHGPTIDWKPPGGSTDGNSSADPGGGRRKGGGGILPTDSGGYSVPDFGYGDASFADIQARDVNPDGTPNTAAANQDWIDQQNRDQQRREDWWNSTNPDTGLPHAFDGVVPPTPPPAVLPADKVPKVTLPNIPNLPTPGAATPTAPASKGPLTASIDADNAKAQTSMQTGLRMMTDYASVQIPAALQAALNPVVNAASIEGHAPASAGTGPFDGMFKGWADAAVKAFTDEITGSTGISSALNVALGVGQTGKAKGPTTGPFDSTFQGYAQTAIKAFMDVINGGKAGLGLSAQITESFSNAGTAQNVKGKGGATTGPFDAEFKSWAVTAVTAFMDVINGGKAGLGFGNQITEALAAITKPVSIGGGGGKEGGGGPFDVQFTSYAQSALENFIKALDPMSDDITTELEQVVQAIADQQINGYQNAFMLGEQIGQGLYDGLISKLGQVMLAGAALASAAQQGTSTQAKIGSPSRVFIELGQFMGDGLTVGMDNRQPHVAAAGANLSKAASTGVDLTSSIRTVGAKSTPTASGRKGDTIQVHIDNLTVSKEADVDMIMSRLETLMGKKIEMVVRGQTSFDDSTT